MTVFFFFFSFFHSVNDTTVRSNVISVISNEEDDATAVEPVEKELDKNGSTEFPIKTDKKSSDVNESLITTNVVNQIWQGESNINKQEVKPEVNTQSFVSDGKQKVPFQKLYHERDSKQLQFSGGEDTKFEQSSTRAFPLEGPSPEIRDIIKTEAQKLAGFGTSAVTCGAKISADAEGTNFQQSSRVRDLSEIEPHKLEMGKESSQLSQTSQGFGSSTVSFEGKIPVDAAGQSNRKDFHSSVEMGKESLGKFGLTRLQSASSESLSSRKFISSKDSDVKAPLVSANSEKAGLSIAAANFSGDLPGKPFQLKDATGVSTSLNFSDRPVQSGGQRPSTASINIESLPSIRSSQMSSLENATSGKFIHHKHYSSRENHRSVPQSGMLNSESNLSKQFGNVNARSHDLCLHVMMLFVPTLLVLFIFIVIIFWQVPSLFQLMYFPFTIISYFNWQFVVKFE